MKAQFLTAAIDIHILHSPPRSQGISSVFFSSTPVAAKWGILKLLPWPRRETPSLGNVGASQAINSQSAPPPMSIGAATHKGLLLAFQQCLSLLQTVYPAFPLGISRSQKVGSLTCFIWEYCMDLTHDHYRGLLENKNRIKILFPLKTGHLCQHATWPKGTFKCEEKKHYFAKILWNVATMGCKIKPGGGLHKWGHLLRCCCSRSSRCSTSP